MSKLHITILYIFFVFSLLLYGCGGGNASKQSENSEAFDSVTLSAYSGNTSIGVTHSVKDYQEWLKIYSSTADPESRISIYTNPEDPNVITVFELTKSHDEAKNLFNADGLKEGMTLAGVSSTPVVRFYDIKYFATGKTDKMYCIILSHAVADYAIWKKFFDEDEPIHNEAGLDLLSISTNAEDPNIVNVMFATNDVKKAKDLINSSDLKKRMTESGVQSEPILTVLKTTKE